MLLRSLQAILITEHIFLLSIISQNLLRKKGIRKFYKNMEQLELNLTERTKILFLAMQTPSFYSKVKGKFLNDYL